MRLDISEKGSVAKLIKKLRPSDLELLALADPDVAVIVFDGRPVAVVCGRKACMENGLLVEREPTEDAFQRTAVLLEKFQEYCEYIDSQCTTVRPGSTRDIMGIVEAVYGGRENAIIELRLARAAAEHSRVSACAHSAVAELVDAMLTAEGV